MNRLPDLMLAKTHIRHRRHSPKHHSLDYDMGYVLANVDRLAQACAPSPFWSHNRLNLVSLHDRDLLQPARPMATQSPVRQALAEALQQQLGLTLGPDQPVHVLTLPRYLGLSFNPVSFYWIYQADHSGLACIAAHITNTPWHERHLYCFACADSPPDTGTETTPTHRFQFEKRFHVSPFMPMSLDYDWRFTLPVDHPEAASVIHMQLHQNGALVFDATMTFHLEPMSVRQQNWFPLSYPMQSLKVVVAIYWQALRLWLKRIPFHTHPGKINSAGH